MKSRSSIYAKLVGGPLDGDELILTPNGSVGPPHQLSYLATTSRDAGWLVYETESLSRDYPNPDAPVKQVYNYIGIRPPVAVSTSFKGTN